MNQQIAASDLSYLKFDPNNEHHRTLIPSLVHCYQRVFADPPWNEWKRCPSCKRHWGTCDREWLTKHSFTCDECNVMLEDFWPAEQVTGDLIDEATTYPGKDRFPSFWVVVHLDNVVGFCWGYSVRVADLAKKLDCPGFEERFSTQFDGVGLVAYQDELGVLSEYRGHGIAKKMVRLRHSDFVERGLKVGIIRTKAYPPSVTYTWYTRLGFEVVSEYGDPEHRVVLARNYEGLLY